MSTLLSDSSSRVAPQRSEADAWEPASAVPALPPHEVHVLRFRLDAEREILQRLEERLEVRERERASRFRFRRDRQRFVAARGALRQILGDYLGIRPEDVCFDYGPHGKPRLSRELAGQGLRFNLAHSGAMAVYALARGREVGIDLERVAPEVAGEGIENRFFSRAEADILARTSGDRRPEAFFRCWTSKEAYLKARGGGLSEPLHSFTVSFADDEGEPAGLIAAAEEGETGRWSFLRLFPAEGYVATLVVEGRGWEVRLREYRP